MSADFHPLLGPPPPEVPLSSAPLVRVIAQVRFPSIVSIGQPEFVGKFQEAIRKEYAVLRPMQTKDLLVVSEGINLRDAGTIWRFFDEAEGWWVSLATNFLALETTAYTNRSDFFSRFNRLLITLEETISPTTFDRIGVRYVDRITGEHLSLLPKFIRPEILGVLGKTVFSGCVRHSICENLFRVDEGVQMRTRWGLVPAGSTVDPTLEPIQEESWILDLDVFSAVPAHFDAQMVADQSRNFAERLYMFFRWVTTDDFLRHYGGTP